MPNPNPRAVLETRSTAQSRNRSGSRSSKRECLDRSEYQIIQCLLNDFWLSHYTLQLSIGNTKDEDEEDDEEERRTKRLLDTVAVMLRAAYTISRQGVIQPDYSQLMSHIVDLGRNLPPASSYSGQSEEWKRANEPVKGHLSAALNPENQKAREWFESGNRALDTLDGDALTRELDLDLHRIREIVDGCLPLVEVKDERDGARRVVTMRKDETWDDAIRVRVRTFMRRVPSGAPSGPNSESRKGFGDPGG